MSGGTEEIQRVSELFDYGTDVSPTSGIGGGGAGQVASLPTGGIATQKELAQMAYDADMAGVYQAGGRRRWTRKTRRWTQRGGRKARRSGRKTRFRLNIRASIRLHHRHRQ